MKKIFTLLVVCLTTISAFAYDIEVDGIYYNLNTTDKTAEVTSKDPLYYEANTYTGSVTIPEAIISNGVTYSVTSIGSYAFGCSFSLTSITIPNSVTYIGDHAFFHCGDMISINMSESVTTIGKEAFYYCRSLTSINIPNTVANIGNSAFFECCRLKSVIIPNSMTNISDSVFIQCDSLTTITIPNSITSIGKDAFHGCCRMKSVKIPNSVISIGIGAFSYCPGLTSILVEDGNPEYDSRDNCNAVIHTETNSLILGCKNTVIPNTITSIGNSAFCGCTSLESVAIPGSVASIGNSAFYGCTSLLSVTIPGSVASICGNAFMSCSNLESIKVSIDNQNYDSRDDCNAIIDSSTDKLITGCKNTVIPSSVTSIGNSAFFCCAGLISITIPNSVTSIGDWAFALSGLTSIDMPNSVASIGDYTFYVCTSLTSIDMPNYVTNIGDYAFYCCCGLTSITLPSSIKSIGDNAFNSCGSLSSFTCKAITVPSTSSNNFDSWTRGKGILRVPASALDAYKSTTPWSKLGTYETFNALNLTDSSPELTAETYSAEDISYTRDITDGSYASLCLPYDVNLKDVIGIEKVYKPAVWAVYNTETERLQLYLKEVSMSSTLPAGTPVIAKTNGQSLVALNASETTIPTAITNPEKTALEIYNTDGRSSVLYENTDISVKWCGTYSALSAVDGMKSFNTDGSFGQHTGTLNPFRAYIMESTTSGNAKIAGIDINLGDDETTGINAIENGQLRIEKSGKIYNLQGQQVETMQRGNVYIINGRKVVK